MSANIKMFAGIETELEASRRLVLAAESDCLNNLSSLYIPEDFLRLPKDWVLAYQEITERRADRVFARMDAEIEANLTRSEKYARPVNEPSLQL